MLQGDEITGEVSRHWRIVTSPGDSRFSENRNSKKRIEDATQPSSLAKHCQVKHIYCPHIFKLTGFSIPRMCYLFASFMWSAGTTSTPCKNRTLIVVKQRREHRPLTSIFQNKNAATFPALQVLPQESFISFLFFAVTSPYHNF